MNATGIGAGQVFAVNNSNGIKNPDGSLFKVSDPISNIAGLNEAGGALPLNSHIASPRIKQPDPTSSRSAIPGRSTRRPRSTWTTSTRAARTSAGVPR